MAAEYGLVGLLVVAALAGWVWTMLWTAAPRHPASASLSAAAVTIVGLHAAVDYVCHLSPVLLVMCALLGSGALRADDAWPHRRSKKLAWWGRELPPSPLTSDKRRTQHFASSGSV